jgi:glycine cleavage system H lipoate-binding protein
VDQPVNVTKVGGVAQTAADIGALVAKFTGITSLAQWLGLIAGKQVGKGEQLGNIESVKAVSELFAPVAGEVLAANDALQDHPELVNQDPFGQGWLVRLKVAPSAAEGLLDAAGYEKFVAEEGGH